MNIFDRNVKGSTEIFQKKTVGIAGCGGLGSNAAVSLVRAGIGRLILVDFDRVETSNLNRQHFFISDIGKFKTEALASHLRAINPEIKLDIITKKIEREDVASLFSSADLLIEAFDKAENKEWLIEEWAIAYPKRPIVCGSGIAGIGMSQKIRVVNVGNIYFVGDGESDMSLGLCSARVNIAAQIEANIALEILFNNESS